ncbi:MAG: cytochrome-c peroxidase [Byssovorax sp.]
MAMAVLAGCAGADSGDDFEDGPEGAAQLADTEDPIVTQGRELFGDGTLGANGRSCATCHVLNEHTQLSPANAQSRFDPANPLSDPLFRAIDADDPTAPPGSLTFDHVKQGLIRVPFRLPANVDLLDEDGNVITPSPRPKVVGVPVWHSVPTIENTVMTAPYQFAGLASDLTGQAGGAVSLHAQGQGLPTLQVRSAIASFEEASLSSESMKTTVFNFVNNLPVFDPDPAFPPGSNEALGKALFQQTCAKCHGGPSGNQITGPGIRGEAYLELNRNGTLKIDRLTHRPRPLAGHESDIFINTGVTFVTSLMQAKALPNTLPVVLPRYRLRFYTDATRTAQVTDLPPKCPLISRNDRSQCFTVDPGRALISGDPADFEAFDIPQLRGIAGTAPYFHDNSSPTLEAVVDLYSRFLLRRFPSVGFFPPVNPAAGPGMPTETFSPAQKQQLVAYLKKI